MAEQVAALPLGATVSFWNRGEIVTGRIAARIIPGAGTEEDPVLRRRGLSAYSGGYCREHRRPAPLYEGGQHIEPTLPYYDVVAKRRTYGICSCAIADAPATELALFDIGDTSPDLERSTA